MNETLEYAHNYINKGFSLIPLRPRDKKPAIPSWKIYQERQTSEAEVYQWFGNGSKYNIAIVTGEISGITVVDLDTPEAVAFAQKNNFPKTPRQRTGKGYHLIYKYKEGTRNFQKRDDLPGIDLRSDGGYIVAAPSIHPSGQQYIFEEGYSLDDLPLAELPEIILAKKKEDKKPIAELYQGATEGNRNDTLARLTGSWVKDGLTLSECLENACLWNMKNNPPLGDKEIQQTVKSIFDKHLREKITEVQPLLISDTSYWLINDPPQLNFIFEGILLKGITGYIHGIGGSGKSVFKISLMFSLITGAELWGVFKPTMPYRVLFLCPEDSPDIIRRRMYIIANSLSQEEREEVQQAIDKNLILIAGQPLPLLELKNGNPVETSGFEMLMALVKEHRPDVLMLDPKSMFYGSLDENSNSHNSAFVSSLKKFNDLGITVLFTHHESKNLAGQGSQFGSRGGQALSDGVRWQISISRMTEKDATEYEVDAQDYVKVEQTKSNYTRFFEPFYLKRGEGGVLDRADLQKTKRERYIEGIREVLRQGITCRYGYLQKAESKPFRQACKDACEITSRDLRALIFSTLAKGELHKNEHDYLCL